MKKIGILLTVFLLAGCATTVKYLPYTKEKFPVKSPYYFVTVYPDTQHPPAGQIYSVIGKVEISGHLNDGVTQEDLVEQAKAIARKKGADAIINTKTQELNYNGAYVVPGRVSYHSVYAGRHEEVVVARYHPEHIVPYSDVLFTFQGELIIFTPVPLKENK